jgi:hypothetical protein
MIKILKRDKIRCVRDPLLVYQVDIREEREVDSGYVPTRSKTVDDS